jgi:hypothetical protein
LIAEPGYQMVAGNRPLLYLHGLTDHQLQALSGPDNAKHLFDEFRRTVKVAGQGDPYIVVMDFHPAHGKEIARAVGATAVTSYAIHGDDLAASYARLTQSARGFWEQCAAAGAEVVPVVMAGWDRRPRIEHPVWWEKDQVPGAGLEKYYQMPTPRELAAHVEEAERWVAARKEQCPAQAVIIYAWNEHDEGGWLCPTLNPDGSANTERLSAIAARVKK